MCGLGARRTGSPWGNVISSRKSLGVLNINLEDLCSKQIGNRLKTCFWTDQWKGSRTLANCFPRLYVFETIK